MKSVIKEKKKLFSILFMLLTLGTFAVWGIKFIHDIEGIQSQVFFWNHNDWFMDLFNPVYYSVDKTPYTWGETVARNYFPFAYMIVYPMRWLYPYDMENAITAYEARYSQYSSIAACAFFILSFGMLFYLLYKSSKESEVEKLGILAALFCSSVTLFNLDRGNQQILTSAFLALFILTYRSKKKWLNHVGYIALAMAAALKIYPALFGILLLYEKKYKDAFITILYGFGFAFLPFFWLSGDVVTNFQHFIKVLEDFVELKGVGALGISAPTILNINVNLKVISYLMAVLALISAPTLKSEWKKLMLLTMVLVMTSEQQSFYCLSFLFLPIVLFFNEEHGWGDILYVLGFVLILSPLQYSWSNSAFRFYPRAVCNTVCILIYIALLAESLSGLVKAVNNRKMTGVN